MRRSTRGAALDAQAMISVQCEPAQKRARVASTAGPLTASVRGPQWATDVQSVGASGERFYGAVRIGTDVFHVGDTVIVRFDGADTTVARIEALWEDGRGAKFFDSRWYYKPEETTCGRLVGHDPRELFESAHVDENPVESIDCACTVMEWDAYQRWLDQPGDDVDDHEEETTFVCRAVYHTGTGEFVPLAGASTLAEAVRVGGRQFQLPNPVVLPRARSSATPQIVDGTADESGSWATSAGDVTAYGRSSSSAVELRRRRLGRFAQAAARLAPSAHPERMPRREKERTEVIGKPHPHSAPTPTQAPRHPATPHANATRERHARRCSARSVPQSSRGRWAAPSTSLARRAQARRQRCTRRFESSPPTARCRRSARSSSMG